MSFRRVSGEIDFNGHCRGNRRECKFVSLGRYVIKNINDERVFIVLYAVSAVYFAGVMVRLMLTLTPCVCILAAIAFSRLFELYLKVRAKKKVGWQIRSTTM